MLLPFAPKPDTSYVLGFSGGLDSTVLLHELHQQALPVRAIHIHHGLQEHADAWAQHCLNQCQTWGVPCEVVRIDARPKAGEGPEAAARRARYAALFASLKAGETLVTAHHQRDQAETLLLNLLRGAGVQGLAAMPVWKDRHYRPLLHTPYPTLQAYAAEHGLKFIEDPHNQDPRYTRSFLRQRVLPVLRERYASLDTRFAHSSQHCAEAALLLAECYQQDAVWQPSWSCEWPVNEPAQALSLPPLLALPLHRQKNVLRHAARQQAESLNESALNALLKLIQHPTPAAVVPWGKHEARVFKQALYFLPQAQPDYLAAAVAAQQGGIARLPNQDGGDRVKKALQALGVPSWARPRLPLLWNGERYVAVWLGQWVRF